MHAARSRRALVVAIAAALVGVGHPVVPLAGIAQSNQQASVGARLMRGAVDLPVEGRDITASRRSSTWTNCRVLVRVGRFE